MRPSSIHAVSKLIVTGTPANLALKSFMDDINVSGENVITKVDMEPVWLDSDMDRVFLAGLSEYICRTVGIKPPLWTEKEQYFLSRPIHFGGSRSRVMLMMETPSSFRRRLLFCGRISIHLPA